MSLTPLIDSLQQELPYSCSEKGSYLIIEVPDSEDLYQSYNYILRKLYFKRLDSAFTVEVKNSAFKIIATIGSK